MDAMASIVKQLNSSTSVFFKAEITESFNSEHAPPSSLHLLYFFSTLSPLFPLTKASFLQGYGSQCEALIITWLLCFKGLAPSCNFPNVASLTLNFWLCQISVPAESQKHQWTITTFLKHCSRISAFVEHMAWLLSCGHRTKGWLCEALVKWKTLWAFVEKSKMTLSLENLDITQTVCYAHDRFQVASTWSHQARWLLSLKAKTNSKKMVFSSWFKVICLLMAQKNFLNHELFEFNIFKLHLAEANVGEVMKAAPDLNRSSTTSSTSGAPVSWDCAPLMVFQIHSLVWNSKLDFI